MKIIKNVMGIFYCLVLASCGSMQKVAVDLTGDIMVKASPEMETEANWDVFKESIPASLKLMEGMFYLEKDHRGLLRTECRNTSGWPQRHCASHGDSPCRNSQSLSLDSRFLG